MSLCGSLAPLAHTFVWANVKVLVYSKDERNFFMEYF